MQELRTGVSITTAMMVPRSRSEHAQNRVQHPHPGLALARTAALSQEAQCLTNEFSRPNLAQP